MKKISSTEWPRRQPAPEEGKIPFMGGWESTLLVTINQAGATLFKYTCRDGDLISVPRKIVTHVDLEPLINSLPYYNSGEKILTNRYSVEFNEEIEKDIVRVHYGEFFVDIKIVDCPNPL